MEPTFQFLKDRFDPDALFLATEKRVYTYRDLIGYARKLEAIFTGKHHSKIVLSAELTDTVVLAVASCWLLEIPVIPISPDTDDSEWKRILQDLQPDVLVSDPASSLSVTNTGISHLTLPSADSITSDSLPLSDFLTNPEHLFGFFLTSGTSGPSKIVPVKRRQFLWAAEGSAKNIKPEPGELWLLSLPLYHVGGISIILRSLLYGSGIFLLRAFKPDIIRNLLTFDKRIRYCSLVPTMLRRILSDPGFRPHNDFKICLLGGGPMSVDLVRAALDHQMVAATSFGMTETAAQIAARVYPLSEMPTDLSAGKLFPPNKVELRDIQGHHLSAGKEGILWISGPQVFDGYLNDRLNASYFDSEGWFCTGDHARIHPDGEIEILMRRTDRIVTGGENVNPIEVEQVLLEHPDIVESAVFGLPDDEWGQRVVALVVRGSDNALVPDLSEYLASHLRGYKIPKEIIFVSDLPYTRTGKLDRSRLPEWFKNS